MASARGLDRENEDHQLGNNWLSCKGTGNVIQKKGQLEEVHSPDRSSTSEQPEETKSRSGDIEMAQQLAAAPIAITNLPGNLKSGIATASGISLGTTDVRYDTSEPPQINASAYAQGSDIHLVPEQEKHLPHEAWHLVEQTQHRVRPAMQITDGVAISDDEALEHEADVMGAKAANHIEAPASQGSASSGTKLSALNTVGQLGSELLDTEVVGNADGVGRRARGSN